MLLDGRAKSAAIYPDRLCDTICAGLKRELEELRRRENVESEPDTHTRLGMMADMMDEDADKMLAVVDIPAEAAAFIETDPDDQLGQEQQHDVGLNAMWKEADGNRKSWKCVLGK